MCGFSFFFNTHSNISKQDLRKFKSISRTELQRRGPDNFESALICFDKLLMCHARLSIQDLSSSANQPMVSKSGRSRIIFNGEIYNHNYLRKEFFEEKFEWRTTSDTETLVELIEVIGIEQALSVCDGMFAICLYDGKNKTISLARDKFGEKPLYYLTNNGYFSGGSKLTVLTMLSKMKIDNDALSQYFQTGFISSPKTIYDDINKVEPGQVITFSTDKNIIISKRTYFDLPKRFLTASRADKFEVDKLDDVLRRKFKNAAIADVEVGVFQSGGIDSSLVSEMSRRLGLPLKYSFTIGFASKELDETAIANMIAERAQRKQIITKFTDQDIIERLGDVTLAFDEPLADPSVVPMMELSRNASQKVKVAFGGDGGDELFLGYNRHRAFRKNGFYERTVAFPFIHRVGVNLINILLKNHFFEKMINSKSELKHKIKKLAKMLTDLSDEEKYWSVISSDMPDLSTTIVSGRFTGYLPKLPKILSECSSSQKIQFLDLRHYLADYVLQKVDRSSMYYSLEVRAPLLSEELLQYSLALDEDQLTDGRQSKKPLLSILTKLKTFPNVHKIYRKKKGFTPPLEEWIRAILRQKKDKYLEEQFLRDQGLFEPQSLNRVVDDFEKYGAYRDFIWRYIIFQNWYEHHAK